MANEPMMDDMNSASNDAQNSQTCNVPVAMLPNTVKPGDIISMKVETMDGADAKLSYMPEDEEENSEMSPDDMKKMSKDDAMKMSVSDLEKKLPKVSEE